MPVYLFASDRHTDDHIPSGDRQGEDTPLSSEALLDRLRSGDERAFAAIVERVAGPLAAYAMSFVRTSDVAKELVQDVLADLWKNRVTVSPRGTLERHLFGAVRFRALHVLRRWKVEAVYMQKVVDPVADELIREPVRPDILVERADLYAAVVRAAQQLPPRTAAVFRLRWGEGLSYAQIAERLGISVKGVEVQMTRAFKMIRMRLDSSSKG